MVGFDPVPFSLVGCFLLHRFGKDAALHAFYNEKCNLYTCVFIIINFSGLLHLLKCTILFYFVDATIWYVCGTRD